MSLFGVNSLDELKFSIFENSANVSEISIGADLQTIELNSKIAAAKKVGKKALGAARQLPGVKSYIGDLGPMLGFSLVKSVIVCIDDIERRGNNLATRDVLGLVSNLEERKHCKVILILNDEALEKDKSDFDRYFEKVIDSALTFEPTPEESTRIAVAGDTAAGAMLRDDCIALGISNIRVLKKVERSVHQIEPLLKSYRPVVLRWTAHAIALFGWCIYEPDRAPAIDFLKRKKPVFFSARNKEQLSETEASWNALLDAYGFSMMDEFGLALLDGIRNGFFDPAIIEKHAAQRHQSITLAQHGSSFENAWRLFHDSFENNQDEVLDGIRDAFLKDVQSISPLNLNGTIALFKDLGRQQQAAELLKYYIDQHSGNTKLFDLNSYAFRENIDDPDVIKAFQDKFATLKPKCDPVAILRSMADTNGWHPDDLAVLAALPVESYYEILRNAHGEELRKLLNTCLQFDRIINADENMREVSRRAKQALASIGRESQLNARRVEKYGVHIDNSSSTLGEEMSSTDA